MSAPVPLGEALTVAIALPPAPHVLVSQDFVATLALVEQRVADLKIVDPPTQQAAADLQTRLTRASAELEKARKAVKQPFLDAGTAIDNAARAPANRIASALAKVKTALAVFDKQQREIAEQKERDRLAEIARLEKIAEAERAEEKRKADALAEEVRLNEEADASKRQEEAAALARANPKVQVEEIAFAEDPPEIPEMPPEPPQKTETELALERAKFAPVVVAPKPQGVTFRTTLRIKQVDPSKLPDVFVVKTANLAALRTTFCTGWKYGEPMPQCSGVEFEINREPVSSGRQVF